MMSKVLVSALIICSIFFLNSCWTKTTSTSDHSDGLILQASIILDKNGKDYYLEASIENTGEKSVVLHIERLDISLIDWKGNVIGGCSRSVFINGQDLSQESILERLLPHSRIYQKLFLRSIRPVDQMMVKQNNSDHKIMVELVGTSFGVLGDPEERGDHRKILVTELSK